MKYFILLFFCTNFLFANDITMSHIYLDKKVIELEKVENQNLFKNYNKDYINIMMVEAPLYIKFTLNNTSQKSIIKILSLTDAKLDKVELFNDKFTPQYLEEKDRVKALVPYFIIKLEPNSSKIYYLKIKSKYGGMSFCLKFNTQEEFLENGTFNQHFVILLLGMLIAFTVYGLILFIYSGDKAYLLYSIYLLVFIYHQGWYLGLSNLYLEYLLFKETIVLQIVSLIITFTFFIVHFLKLGKFPVIIKVLNIFVFISILEGLVLSLFPFYGAVIPVLTGSLYILFVNIASMYIYFKGNKYARYFIIAYWFGSAAYLAAILEYFNLIRIANDYPYLVLIGVTTEAIILLLAFFDQDSISLKEKIRRKVVEKDLKLEKLRIREIHHRVKNNLEMILSIIDIQSKGTKDKTKFEDLKNRIFAMAQTYNLLSGGEQDTINMKEYITQLIESIKSSMQESKDITTIVNIQDDIKLPLNKSIYLGLIINELIVNSFKYAFDKKGGQIKITFMVKNEKYVLEIEDNGRGFERERKEDSFGLILVDMLVKNDLKGEMQSITKDQTKYIIRF